MCLVYYVCVSCKMFLGFWEVVMEVGLLFLVESYYVWVCKFGGFVINMLGRDRSVVEGMGYVIFIGSLFIV